MRTHVSVCRWCMRLCVDLNRLDWLHLKLHGSYFFRGIDMAKNVTKTKANNKADNKPGNMSNKIRMKNHEQKTDELLYLMALCPFFTGLAQHYQLLFAGIIIMLLLLYRRFVNKELLIYKNAYLICGVIILLSAVASVFWGESHGDSIYGLCRIVTLILFGLLLMQYNEEERVEVRSFIPFICAAMTVLSAVMFLMPGLSKYVFVNQRLAGFFQYPNTYALFLLLGLYLYIKEKQVSWKQPTGFVIPMILLAGILWTGSRTTFVIMTLMLVYLLIRYRDVRKSYLLLFIIGAVVVAIYLLLSGNLTSIGRFMTIGGQNSTLWGRLLYDKDAIRMIIKRPYGYGYLGYYLAQQALQHGVYTVRFCHNDWLQMALDYGVLAMLALIYIFVHALLNGNDISRGALILIAAHMLFEFDLQYGYMVFILMLFLDLDEGQAIHLKNKALMIVLIPIALAFLWLGGADLLAVRGDYEASHHMYPWAADVEMHAMAAENELDKQNNYALHLIHSLSHCGVAYDVRAIYEEGEGNYLEMLANKKQAVEYQKYNITKYREYDAMIQEAMAYYKDRDSQAYEKCRAYQDDLSDMLANLQFETDPLAYKIKDKPVFEI